MSYTTEALLNDAWPDPNRKQTLTDPEKEALLYEEEQHRRMMLMMSEEELADLNAEQKRCWERQQELEQASYESNLELEDLPF